MAKDHEVVVYGSKADNEGLSSFVDRNVQFRFVQPAVRDSYLYKIRTRVSRVVHLQPQSTSPFYYPDYGSKIAYELSKEKFDVIHIQHTGQYAPIIRKLNPKAKIILHLHAEWFSQSKPTTLMRRIQALDMLTGVSDYVSRRVGALLPSLNKPCVTHYNGFDPSEFAREKDYA